MTRIPSPLPPHFEFKAKTKTFLDAIGANGSPACRLLVAILTQCEIERCVCVQLDRKDLIRYGLDVHNLPKYIKKLCESGYVHCDYGCGPGVFEFAVDSTLLAGKVVSSTGSQAGGDFVLGPNQYSTPAPPSP